MPTSAQMTPEGQAITSLMEMFRPKAAPGQSDAYRQRMMQNIQMGQAQAGLGNTLAQKRINEIQANALQYEHMDRQLAHLPEEQRRAIILGIQTKGGSDLKAVAEGLGTLFETGARGKIIEQYDQNNPRAVEGLRQALGLTPMLGTQVQGNVLIDPYGKPTQEAPLTPLGVAMVGTERSAATENYAQAAKAGRDPVGGEGGGRAPSGYRWSADGLSLAPIAGGPADKEASLSPTQRRIQNTAQTKLVSLAAIQRQVQRVKELNAKLKNTLAAGPVTSGVAGYFSEDAANFDAAKAMLAASIRQLTRTPGEGAMSDYESRLAEAGNPSRSDWESATDVKISQLEDLLATTIEGYKNIYQDNGGNLDRIPPGATEVEYVRDPRTGKLVPKGN